MLGTRLIFEKKLDPIRLWFGSIFLDNINK